MIADARISTIVVTTSSSMNVNPCSSAPPPSVVPWNYLTVTVTGLNCSGTGAPSGVLATPLTWIIEPP